MQTADVVLVGLATPERVPAATTGVPSNLGCTILFVMTEVINTCAVNR